MKINPSSSVRTTLYVLSVAINAFMAVLLTSEVVISVFVLAGIASFNAVVALMAGINVTPDNEL